MRKRLPVILQAEITECGLACATMIGQYYGHRIDLSWMRTRYASSLSGMSLRRTASVVDDLGLKARVIRCSPNVLQRFGRPLILYWGNNHFVVFDGVKRDRYIVHDPAKGRCEIDAAEFSRQFSGYAIDAEPDENFEVIAYRKPPRFGNEVRNIMRSLVGAGTLLLLVAVCLELTGLVGPLLLQWVIERVIGARDVNLLYLLSGLFAFAILLKATLSVARDWSIASVSASFVRRWGSDVFHHLLRLPLPYFEKRNIGDVLSRYLSIQSIQSILSTNIISSIIDGGTSLIALALISAYSWWFTLLAASTLLVYGSIRLFIYTPLMLANQEQLNASARQESLMIESVRGIATVKLFNDHGGRTDRFTSLFTLTLNKMIRVKFLSSMARSGNEAIMGLCRLGIIALGARGVLGGSFTIGAFVAAVAYVEMFLLKAAALVDNLIELRLLDLHVDRLRDITEQTKEDLGKGFSPTRVGALRFENVGFRYADDEPWILRHFNETIKPGESVALAGPSGVGKTTLVKLILGFLEPTEGRILYDGVDIADIGRGGFRSICGTVLQSDRLFSGSVEDNICFFETDRDQERMVHAARLAAIDDEVQAFPMGYKTLVGDMGSALSAGQEQRILLARAIYRRPQLLLLDEATSHLDVVNERLISRNVAALNMTRMMVAHRPETIASAERVIHLDYPEVGERDAPVTERTVVQQPA
ncbi:ATP-binding cassette subfamily B protein RaxB [Luteibacter jiangsuensis]|uniref:ATP-binding cassette subfamily B protein RaxB n=1 Tax=Luteibacter jiangsuensis TaxID=637577 RepID=A0ABT9STE0_9GAMM|nr:peptidase domain-containing ABC transporter [Luteibacter jiangsuensis]MDQ0008254.1 ATP-binding cassette subfamily B protein RaxB [Luteibacter jiangsuensis]